jgi:ubiquinol-cytochrome c reductase cytochrome c subunit
LEDGRALYAANCLACHGAGAQGASVGGGSTAPALDVATPVQIAEAVRIGPGVMPVFGPKVLDEPDLNSLIRYVEFLRGARDPGGLDLGYAGPVAEGFVAWLVGMGCLLLAAWLIERPHE